MRRLFTILGATALVLAGCGSDDDSGSVSVTGAWARPSADAVTSGVIYLELEAAEADTLVAASVPASVAGEVQIHEVVAVEPDDTAMDDSAMDTDEEMSGGEMPMRMQELDDGLALPAGEVVRLEPGGYHIMLLDLVEPLVVGGEIEVTLDFETAASANVTVEVAESAP